MSIDKTLAERGARYGRFADHAAIAQALQDVLRAAPGWARLSYVQRQALTVICDKQARILSGDPNYADNWHDIQGYAKLAEDDLYTAAVAEGIKEANAGATAPLQVVREKVLPTCARYPKEEGWIERNGGACPLPSTTLVDAVMGNGARYSKSEAGLLDWRATRTSRISRVLWYRYADLRPEAI